MPVQPLPENPRLGKLKATAKLVRDLVRAGDQGGIDFVVEHHPRLGDLRPGDRRAAAFRLASAQLALARHHGFPSWPQLRRHVELRAGLARSPHRQPIDEAAATVAEQADQLLRLACLTYGSGDHSRPSRARDLLDRHPALATASIHAVAATGAAAAAVTVLAGDPAAASRLGGPFDWPPLLYATYSRLPGADTLPVARLLLEAGADPNAGYLWDGLVPPFTALTGAIGGGERGERPHARSLELAALLIEAGADANDSQAIYNRGLGDVALDDTDWLELLLLGGLGRGDGGPWYRLLAPAVPTPAEIVAEALQHAAEAGLVERTRLLLSFGADPDGRGVHPCFAGRSAYQGAVASGSSAVVELLEAAGADRASVDGPTRFVGACLAGDRATIDRLAATGTDLLGRVRRRHPDLVARAAELGRPSAVRLLVGLGFDVDTGPRTALHEAALRGDDAVVRTLLELGADPSIEDGEHHSTPQGWAEFAGHHATARILADAAGRPG
jgi:ankyrin repeat protein